MNIWQSYKQERGCLMHIAHLANTLLKDGKSARDSHVLACNFATYSLRCDVYNGAVVVNFDLGDRFQDLGPSNGGACAPVHGV